MKTYKEIAIEYGVPMPETCGLLNWQGKTLFTWYLDDSNIWDLCLTREFDRLSLHEINFCSAPQIHQLLAANPEIGYDPEGFFYKKIVNFYGKKEVYTKDVEDEHFAEALAQLIIVT